MIIHCTTPQQIEDVIATEKLTAHMTPYQMFKWYDHKESICIDTDSDMWEWNRYNYYLEKGYTITPYSDWKMSKLQEEYELIDSSIVDGYHSSLALEKLKQQRKLIDEMYEIVKEESQMKTIFIDGEYYVKVNDDYINIKSLNKPFTINKDCEITYNNYTVESYESLGLGRCVYISENGEKHHIILNPTPDKVLAIFKLYGIDVEVIE